MTALDETLICTTDAARAVTAEGWNRSEYLSATGQSWCEGLYQKVGCKSRKDFR